MSCDDQVYDHVREAVRHWKATSPSLQCVWMCRYSNHLYLCLCAFACCSVLKEGFSLMSSRKRPDPFHYHMGALFTSKEGAFGQDHWNRAGQQHRQSPSPQQHRLPSGEFALPWESNSGHPESSQSLRSSNPCSFGVVCGYQVTSPCPRVSWFL